MYSSEAELASSMDHGPFVIDPFSHPPFGDLSSLDGLLH